MSKFKKMRMLAVLMAGAGVLSACSSGRLEQAMGSDAAVKVADLPIKFALTDTMQNTCFDNAGKAMTCAKSGENLYGQDAQYSSLQPSFTDNKNATITDNNSGLMWQKSPDFSKYSYDDAISYCAKETLNKSATLAGKISL